MLYTKYESSGPCSFRQFKDFWKLHIKTYFFTPWPTYATKWNGLNNFGRETPRDHSCEVWSKSNERFQRSSCLKKLLTDGRTDGRTMDDGQLAITKAHLENIQLFHINYHMKSFWRNRVIFQILCNTNNMAIIDFKRKQYI